MYAVIEDSGQQIKVSEGDVIQVDPRPLAEDAVTIDFDRVMLIGGEGEQAEPKIGQPLLEGARVRGEIVDEGRSEKVDVVKFRRRTNYKRWHGHRQPYLSVKITEING
jgi:large subunit ribosomal protein L21